ncbi:YybH family protein [Streptomyces phytophilus]|uniref:YybH family protein n=1 Tax=Streptomyces phytophilus TaxID=722715 RepID=UPI00215D75B4|nr:ester cyclase [Streptomyces phytophilus]
MDTTSTRDLFERYHACREARDPARIAELHTPDSVFHPHSGQPPARGRDEIRAAAADSFALVPDLAFDLPALRGRHRPGGLRPGPRRRGTGEALVCRRPGHAGSTDTARTHTLKPD